MPTLRLAAEITREPLDQTDAWIFRFAPSNFFDRAFRNAGVFGDLRPAPFMALELVDYVLMHRFRHGR